MNRKTKAALEGSILKWELILAGITYDRGWVNCPLCWIFFDKDCTGCPVQRATGRTSCDGSPYMDLLEHRYMKACRFEKGCEKCDKLIRKEIRFLKSLRETNGLSIEPTPRRSFKEDEKAAKKRQLLILDK